MPASAIAVEYTDLGTYGADGAIPDTQRPAPAESESDFLLITFTENVELSGTLGGIPGSSDFDLYIYTTTVTGSDASLDELVLSSADAGDEAFSGAMLTDQDYLIAVNTYSDGGDDEYELSLATTTVSDAVPSMSFGGLVFLAGLVLGVAAWTGRAR